jgi:hypothetical protein
MPGRAGNTTYVPGIGKTGRTRKGRRKPVHVSVPYAPTKKGKEAEEEARGHVTIPYAPTPTGKAAEHKAAQKAARTTQRERARKARRVESRSLRRAKRIIEKTPPPPDQVVEEAKRGIKPPESKQWRRAFPEAAKRADLNYVKHVGQHEGLKEDPLAELAISTAATAGVGGLAGLAGKAGAEGVAAAGAKLASTEAGVGEQLAEKGVKAVAARTASKAGKGIKARAVTKAERIRSTPKRIKSAPKRAKRAATTREGRRAAAKTAGRKAKRHPLRTGYGAAVVTPEGVLPGDATKRARAAAEGTFAAITGHPGETAKTTLRSLPAAITAPAALLGAAGESVVHGTPKPLVDTAEEQAKGVAEIAKNTFSGDPKKAEEAARKEGSLAFLTPLPAVTRLEPFKRGRRVVRDKAATVRGKLAAKGEAANRSIRHAPKGTEQTVFAAAGRHQARKKTALIKQRADNPHNVARAHHEKQITDAISKAPKGSEVALQTLAEYGIRDKRHADLVREKGPGDAQLAKALDYVDSHSEIFQSKSFQKALQAVEEASRTAPAALVGKGERARLMQQGDVFGHARPEHMVPEKAKALSSATTREAAWGELAVADKRVTQLRREGRAKLDQTKIAKGAQRDRLRTEGKALYAQARGQFTKNRELFKALDPYTRPGQAIDRSVRRPYDSQMLNEYKQRVEASRQAEGMAPAIWTAHNEANTAGRGTGMENRFPTSAGLVEHMREGNLARADNLDRSLEGLVRGTVHAPRMRAAGKQFGRDLVQHFKTPFTIDSRQKVVGQGSKDWTSITASRTKDNPNGGQFDPKSWARFPLREWKNAIKDPFTEDSRLVALLDDAENGKVKGSEPWVLMPREAIREARAQISPEHNVITETANRFSRTASRLLLGTNPAWAIAQIPAEGIPLLMAKPSLLNPVKLASLERDIQRYKKTHPEEALALQATAGASPLNSAANRTPLDMQETYTPALWEKGAKALTRGKAARGAVSFAKLRALGVFDVKRQNEYRTLLAAAEADKRFRSWHTSLTGLFDKQAKLSRDFRGKSRAELWTWLTKDPKGKVELQKLTDYVDNIQGNWSAFTRYERSLAPLAIFYPFLRYSLRWTLWTFPRTHPITATLAYTLGQANANQLEKLVGGPLQNPIAYAFPSYATGDFNRAAYEQAIKGGASEEQAEAIATHNVLPGGSRISPGQSSLTQSVATGNPAQILSSANPFLGAAVTGITGIEPFTGEKADQQGWAALNSLINLPAPPRLAKIKIGDEGQSAASKAFEQFDQSKTERSMLFPFIPQSGEDFAGAEHLSKSFDQKYGKGHEYKSNLAPEVWEAAYNGDWKAAKRLRRLREQAEAGADVVKKAESPYFEDSGELGKEGAEILKYITGQIVLPAEEKKEPKGQYGGAAGQYSSGPGQYSAGAGQYSSGPGQYGGG